ncbi:MAG: hypothetical protein PVF69_13370, partial [Gemmatimonadota bacterium]
RTASPSCGRRPAIHPEEVLLGLGEVAAAFAGFSGVVAALGSRSVYDLPEATRFRFANLLIASVAAALFAFIPIVIGQFPFSSSIVWATSSSLLGIFCLVFLVVRWRTGGRIPVGQNGALRMWMAMLFGSVLVAVSLLQAANAAGWPFDRSGGPYAVGVLGLLALSGFQFILLALASVPGEPVDPAA